jgi:cytochrome b involved in lipid metabolism
MVYDVTKYLNDHPGGPEIMMEFAGTIALHCTAYCKLHTIPLAQLCCDQRCNLYGALPLNTVLLISMRDLH